jgi:hypothetical protein
MIWATLERASARQHDLDTTPRGRSLAEAGQELYQLSDSCTARVGRSTQVHPNRVSAALLRPRLVDSTRKVATLRSLGDLRVNPSLASVLLP